MESKLLRGTAEGVGTEAVASWGTSVIAWATRAGSRVGFGGREEVSGAGETGGIEGVSEMAGLGAGAREGAAAAAGLSGAAPSGVARF